MTVALLPTSRSKSRHAAASTSTLPMQRN